MKRVAKFNTRNLSLSREFLTIFALFFLLRTRDFLEGKNYFFRKALNY